MPRALLVAILVLLARPVAAADSVPNDPRDRVAHHLREVDGLARHLEGVLSGQCPRFPSPREWEGYVDSEIDRVVLLMAHLEQAWIEAKQTPDDELRRTAKAPRKRVDQARALVDKLQQCASDNGTGFTPLFVWQRIEREVPRRQTEIALPH